VAVATSNSLEKAKHITSAISDDFVHKDPAEIALKNQQTAAIIIVAVAKRNAAQPFLFKHQRQRVQAT